MMKTVIKQLRNEIKKLNKLYLLEKKPAYESAKIAIEECIKTINHNTYLDRNINCLDDMLDVVDELDYSKYDYEINLIRIEK